MPFVKRNQQGHIIGLFSEAQTDTKEELPANHRDVLRFLAISEATDNQNYRLNQSDNDFIRVLEDLIDILLKKHIILLTDLPQAAQNKLLTRKKMRQEFTQSILSEESDNIF
jgi:hypothetical protein